MPNTLIEAIIKNDKLLAQALIDSGADLIEGHFLECEKYATANTALHAAAFYGRPEIMKMLLEAKTKEGKPRLNINQVNSLGENPLHLLIASMGREEVENGFNKDAVACAELLLFNGVDIIAARKSIYYKDGLPFQDNGNLKTIPQMISEVMQQRNNPQIKIRFGGILNPLFYADLLRVKKNEVDEHRKRAQDYLCNIFIWMESAKQPLLPNGFPAALGNKELSVAEYKPINNAINVFVAQGQISKGDAAILQEILQGYLDPMSLDKSLLPPNLVAVMGKPSTGSEEEIIASFLYLTEKTGTHRTRSSLETYPAQGSKTHLNHYKEHPELLTLLNVYQTILKDKAEIWVLRINREPGLVHDLCLLWCLTPDEATRNALAKENVTVAQVKRQLFNIIQQHHKPSETLQQLIAEQQKTLADFSEAYEYMNAHFEDLREENKKLNTKVSALEAQMTTLTELFQKLLVEKQQATADSSQQAPSQKFFQ